MITNAHHRRGISRFDGLEVGGVKARIFQAPLEVAFGKIRTIGKFFHLS